MAGLEHVAQEEATGAQIKRQRKNGRKTKRWQRSRKTHSWMSERRSLQQHANKSLNQCVGPANRLELKFKCTFGKTWMDKTKDVVKNVTVLTGGSPKTTDRMTLTG